MRYLLLIFILTSLAAGQPLTYGEKPADFDGTQAPTDRAASVNTPLEVRYPDSAMRAQRQGVTLVAAWIDAKGYVKYAEVNKSSGHGDLDAEALRAVVEGDFKPAWRENKPCASRISVPVEFRLARAEDEYDAVKTDEQLQQETEELRKAKRMLEEEQRQLEAEIQKVRDEVRRIQEKQQRINEEREKTN